MKFSKKNLPKILFVAALIFLAVKFLKKSEYATAAAAALTYEQEQAKKSIDNTNNLTKEINKTRSKKKQYPLCSTQTKNLNDRAAYNCSEYYSKYTSKGKTKSFWDN